MNNRFNKLSFVLLLFLFLFSCQQEEKNKKVTLVLDNGFLVIDTFPDGKAKTTYKVLKDDTTRTLVEVYHPNGQLSLKGEVVRNQRDGEWTAWDENHRIITIGHYSNGVEDGSKSVWYPSGKLYYEGIFKNGNRSGIWRFYKENGSLDEEINYDTTNIK